jgi:hypothetical protein
MKLFNHLGVEFTGEGENIKTECIHCGSDALSIDEEPPHQYQCFRCKATGNAFTYLRKWYETLPKLTKDKGLFLASLKKGTKATTFRDEGVRFFNDCYWIPVYSNKYQLMAVHKYVPEINIVYGSPKPTSLTVLGLQNLSKAETVWIAEGHWDYFTLLPYMMDTGIDLLGSSGSYFNSALLHHLKNKHIVMLYDNDAAGSDGVDHIARNVKTHSLPHLSLSYLDWGLVQSVIGNQESGFDIRDLKCLLDRKPLVK